MKKDKPHNTKVNKDEEIAFLKNTLENFIKNHRNRHGFLPERWVRNQEQLINWIIGLSPEQCIALLGYCLSVNEAIENYSNETDNRLHIYYFQELIDLAKPTLDEDFESFNNHCKSYGTIGLMRGYEAIMILAHTKLMLHFDNYLTAKWAFLVYCANEMGNSTMNKQALEKLLKVVKKIYEKETHKKIENKDEIEHFPYHLWKVVKKQFPEDLLESLILATKGDRNIRYIPRRTADRLRTKKQRVLKKTRKEISYDMPITPGSEITFKNQLEDKSSITTEEILELSENQKIIAESLELIRSGLINTGRTQKKL
ncbi:MAG: hypothetical protein ACM3SR_19250 [Ignavibacteriales bacterium]